MNRYKVWERAVYKARTIKAEHIYAAVDKFAKTKTICLNSMAYMTGTSKSNPARFIAAYGSAREFTAYETREEQ